ncbi:MAG: glutamate-1-semialdehyde 2,1-aminomutase [Nitrospinae bacterium]|nr:glutamate-1-semialdehyde 2,1-aminomutase [Nitrospinota bacterium]MDA1108227.1 glutamate-1-semialdehyde 2,1-aminomutase [Nitrospinota bacterium]
MNRSKSEELFSRAQSVMPGGVNSPVRAFKAVGGHPLFIKKGQGARITDVDGSEFIDYVSSWGPLIFGHAHPEIVEAIRHQAGLGTSFGAPTKLEIILAEKVVQAVPSMDVVRMVNSGTEAVMSAIRLARGITGRDKILKFEGCYHGHADSMLVKAGSGLMSLGIPECPGIVADLAKNTLTLPYNDSSSVDNLFAEQGDEIACIIVEPIAGNMGVVPPQPGFLQTLRDVTRRSGTLLIFDEVISGFRVGLGGAQELYDILPDLTCLGKIIGGGLPVGAYGGTKEIMDQVSPTGSIYQAGTLSGNPLAMAAGIKMLELLSAPGVYEDLEAKSEKLCAGFKDNVQKLGIHARFTRVGAMFSMFFTSEEIVDFHSVKTCDTEFFKRYFNAMLDAGIYIAPSQFESGFMSAVHTQDDINQTIEANFVALKKARG